MARTVLTPRSASELDQQLAAVRPGPLRAAPPPDADLDVFEHPAMAEIEILSLRSTDGELAGLRAAAPRMRSLRSLAIRAEPAAVLDAALVELASTPVGSALEELTVYGGCLSPRALAGWSFDRLAILALCSAGIDGAGAAELGALSAPRLERLRLANGYGYDREPRWRAGNNCLGGAIAGLLDGPLVDGVQGLGLSFAALSDADVVALAASPRLAQLQFLSLAANGQVGDPGATALAGSAHLGHLHTLDLNHTAVGADGARALVGSGALPSLRRLGILYAAMPPSDEIEPWYDWMGTVAWSGPRRPTLEEIRELLGAPAEIELF